MPKITAYVNVQEPSLLIGFSTNNNPGTLESLSQNWVSKQLKLVFNGKEGSPKNTSLEKKKKQRKAISERMGLKMD